MKQLSVCFKPGIQRGDCLRMHKEMQVELVKEIEEIDVHVVRVPDHEVTSCLIKYSSSLDVQFAEEDHVIQVEPVTETTPIDIRNTITTTNDPLVEQQWGLANINAPGAWDLARISPVSAAIAILDTGINYNHPDLRRKIIHQANFSSSPTVEDIHGHGTHVAGIAAAVTNNGNGIAGVSYNSSALMNIKVLGDDGGGTNSNVAEGIIYAANIGAHVINMSFGSGVSNETIRAAVTYAYNRGVLLVAAAGNSSSTAEHFPAAYQQVLAVAATNQSNELASFSNFGSWVDIAAPGQDILSTYTGDTPYRVASGTSQATPFISGLAGLMKATNPTLTNREMRSIIEQAAIRPISGGTVRFGRIDAMRAIQITPTGSPRRRTNNFSRVWLKKDLR